MPKKLFRCKECGYEFNLMSGKTKPPARCPYCSKEGVVDVKKHVLEEI